MLEEGKSANNFCYDIPGEDCSKLDKFFFFLRRNKNETSYTAKSECLQNPTRNNKSVSHTWMDLF